MELVLTPTAAKVPGSLALKHTHSFEGEGLLWDHRGGREGAGADFHAFLPCFTLVQMFSFNSELGAAPSSPAHRRVFLLFHPSPGSLLPSPQPASLSLPLSWGLPQPHSVFPGLSG